MNHYLSLREKIDSGNVSIGVLGLGYVGVPLSFELVEAGFEVTGFDIDKSRVIHHKKGCSYLSNISSSRFCMAGDRGFVATSDFSRVNNVDVIILCLPTPVDKYKTPNLSNLISALDSISGHLIHGQLVILESTSYPGTTEEIIQPKLEELGFALGENFFLCYSPEREDPGNEKYSTKTIPKVCSGATESCLELGVLLYRKIIHNVIPLSSPKAAEMVKLLENIYRAVNIGLVNEMKTVADLMGIDIHEVIKAAATKPFGFTPFEPGPGLGGHCIPVDPFYLIWKSKEYGHNSRLISTACEINDAMPSWVVNKIIHALNSRGYTIKGAKILVLGVSYKKNIGDFRESPSIRIISSLFSYGAAVSYSDPFVKVLQNPVEPSLELKSVDTFNENLFSYHAVVIACDHDDFDYDFIIQNSRLVIDSRGRYSEAKENLIKA